MYEKLILAYIYCAFNFVLKIGCDMRTGAEDEGDVGRASGVVSSSRVADPDAQEISLVAAIQRSKRREVTSI